METIPKKSWGLSEGLFEYMQQRYLIYHISKRTLKKEFFLLKSVSKNVKGISITDLYIKELLSEDKSVFTLNHEEAFKTIHGKIGNVFGSFLKLYSSMGEEKKLALEKLGAQN